MITIVLATDHRGFMYKEYIKKQLPLIDPLIECIDVGAYDESRSDYPVYAHKACRTILQGQANYGILLCGSGIGMAIAANRYKGIYAALAWNVEVARESKTDDNANVLVLPADYVLQRESIKMITAWLSAEFKGGRYAQRLAMIEKQERLF